MEKVYHNFENDFQQLIMTDGNVRSLESLRKLDDKYGLNTQDYELRFLKDMKTKLQVQLSKAEGIVQKLEDKLKKKELERTNVQKQLENVKSDFENTKSLLETSEDEVGTLKRKIEKLEIQNKNLMSDLKKEEERNEELEESKTKELLKAKSTQDDLIMKNTLINQLEKYNKCLYDQNKSLENQANDLSTKLEKMTHEIEDQEILRARINELKAENNNLRMELTEINVTKALVRPHVTTQQGSLYEELSLIPGVIQKEISTQTSGLNCCGDVAHDNNWSIDSQDFVDGINMNSTGNLGGHFLKFIFFNFFQVLGFFRPLKFATVFFLSFWFTMPFLCLNLENLSFLDILNSFFKFEYNNSGPRPS